MNLLFYCSICGNELEMDCDPRPTNIRTVDEGKHPVLVAIKPCSVCPDPRWILRSRLCTFIDQLSEEIASNE